MGQVSLAAFRSRLDRALGNRDVGEGVYDGWINDGYFDMTGSHDFIELRTVAKATLDAEQGAIEVPAGLQWVRALLNVADKEKLVKLASEHFHLMSEDFDDDTPVRYYTRDGDALYVKPTYSEDKELTILFNREPDRLVNSSDVTVLPATYDKPLHQFTMFHALSDLGEEARGTEWRNNAILYLRSRLDPDDYESAPGTHAGARFPRTAAEFRGL